MRATVGRVAHLMGQKQARSLDFGVRANLKTVAPPLYIIELSRPIKNMEESKLVPHLTRWLVVGL
jgi:hypothetical protein